MTISTQKRKTLTISAPKSAKSQTVQQVAKGNKLIGRASPSSPGGLDHSCLQAWVSPREPRTGGGEGPSGCSPTPSPQVDHCSRCEVPALPITSLPQPSTVRAGSFHPSSKVWKLREVDVKRLVQGHTASEWNRSGPEPSLLPWRCGLNPQAWAVGCLWGKMRVSGIQPSPAQGEQ